MGKIKDWARCAVKNKFTLGGLLLSLPSTASTIYFGLTNNSEGFWMSMAGIYSSITSLVLTGVGMDTYQTYIQTRRIISEKGHLPNYIRPCTYCDRKGIELAVEDSKEVSGLR